MTNQKYFFSDLDGTLINEDMLYLSIKLILKKKPLKFLLILFGAWKGLPWLKNEIAANIDKTKLDVSPNKNVLDLVKQKKKEGYNCYLISGSNYQLVKSIFNQYDLFDCFYGSDSNINLVGSNKLKKIMTLAPKFEYIGNSRQDIPIWKQADIAYICNSSERFNKRVVSLLPKHKKIKIVK